MFSFLWENDEGNTVLVLYDITTGVFTEAKDFGREIENSKWGPSETVFVYSTLIATKPSWSFPHDNLTVEVDGAAAQVYDEGFVYHWGSWEDGTYEHVHYISVTKDETVAGKYSLADGNGTDIMPNADGHCPERPYGFHQFTLLSILLSSFRRFKQL